ncbi:LytTR family two component transcriptional regulator [Algoriphagus aquaeductus]|uniref:LytTR family two component transcriptional regulator n=1 Tax=Algoriphagus aquaeductus TaxID=475299 RepID=A0A326RXV5_9BACT|nr:MULTISPECIES: LytTR family DNA-binding domain-containing protein [Algoriphagus]PZV83162.1 LytTR family two component transcriptional regulator [Algoriphagus aquaeductus]
MNTSKLRVIIVEDEYHSRETLKGFLETYCPETEILDTASQVAEAVQKITHHRPDLVFMDIELQTGTGFEVLQQVTDLDFHLIFTTAFEHYAIQAIKFSSIDYLLKPIDLDELIAAVAKAKKRVQSQSRQSLLENLLQNMLGGSSEFKKICLSTAEGIEFIPTREILYCEANGSYTDFHLVDKRKLVVSKNLKEYENLLGDFNFMRVHNSFLINLGEVKKYVRSEGGYIVMNNEKQVAISGTKKEEFLRRMGI